MLSLISFIAISGCQGFGETPTSEFPHTGVPNVTNGVEPSVPTTPEAGVGVIIGQLISSTTGSPLPNQTVYLGDLLPLDPGDEYLITLEVESSPNTQTDDEGFFIFEGVQPGRYPLIIWTPFKSYVIPDETGEKELAVDVEAGEVVELGDILVVWP